MCQLTLSSSELGEDTVKLLSHINHNLGQSTSHHTPLGGGFSAD